MDRLDAMGVFARIVERGSFVRAAEDLGLPASTATDAVKQLENRLGVRLLDRTTRQVRTTPDGDAYYRRCLSILAEVEDAEGGFGGAKPKGMLRVNVLGAHARNLILPGLAEFFGNYPDIELYLSEADSYVDLVREGIDCVIRSGALGDSELTGRRIALVSETSVVAPDYIDRFGRPEAWDQLDGHKMVGFRSRTTGGVMPLEFIVDGETRTVVLDAPLTVSGTDTLRVAALQGLGIIQVPRYAVSDDIDAGRLVEVLAQTPPAPMPVHVLYPANRHLNLRVRVFIDWVVERYAGLS